MSQNPYDSGSGSAIAENGERRPTLVYVAIGLAVIVTLGANLSWLPLFRVPTGTSIRPMLEAVVSAAFAFRGLFVAVPLCISAIHKHGNHQVAVWIALFFSLFAFPLSTITLHWIAALRGLTLLEIG